MVEVEVSTWLDDLWGQYLCQANPKIKNLCSNAGVDQIIENLEESVCLLEVSDNPVYWG